MADNLDLGKQGEQQACSFLEEKGYTVMVRNYRYKRAEVDIIARKGNLLVFVEVKTRRNTQFGEPEDAVGNAKTRMLLSAAEQYIDEINWQHDIRFDIIAVHCRHNWQIHHFEDAFH